MLNAKYRNSLPQMNGKTMLTDGGLETTLIFLEGMDLPHFASFDVLKTDEGRAATKNYYRPYAELARAQKMGFVLESATWRASPDWGKLLGYSTAQLEQANRASVTLLEEIRDAFETAESPFVISGNLGPRGDGYSPTAMMSVEEACDYHSWQIGLFADAGVDVISAVTMNYVEEALGIAHAAKKADMPVILAYTVETDGKLPTGQSLGDAIEQTDRETGNYPAYYMINCAHPTHFRDVVDNREGWLSRIGGLRANASKMSHAELDNAEELDAGDPHELGREYHELMHMLPNLMVLGGCCGTDIRHVAAIHDACNGHRKAA
ncbi:homocysteine S-methyltransferase family protein [Hoeflea sp. WL0058]|uniref:Homocysteine S-methyltransferase family protein n=1 Tax=Flavimaribacter sediminis TaxID=2865987 RepID=A0AAE2ZHM1_9HYPH|nr:homocysteine S-methyltransferase family protein [Flavimaribacter sediminis]MBW8636859.1 homocysteine S-methyltransferase family protein [Flavimaribacter sediminis]